MIEKYDRNRGKLTIQNQTLNSRKDTEKDIHLPAGKTTAFDCQIVKEPPDTVEGPINMKIKSQRDDCTSNFRGLIGEWQIHMNVKDTCQGELHLYKGQNIEIVDLRSAGCFHITRNSIQRCLQEIHFPH